MSQFNKFNALLPMTKALSAPVHTGERAYLNLIAEGVKGIQEAEERREWAEQLPHNQAKARHEIKPTALMDASVLKTLGKGGSLVDEEG